MALTVVCVAVGRNDLKGMFYKMSHKRRKQCPKIVFNFISIASQENYFMCLNVWLVVIFRMLPSSSLSLCVSVALIFSRYISWNHKEEESRYVSLKHSFWRVNNLDCIERDAELQSTCISLHVADLRLTS